MVCLWYPLHFIIYGYITTSKSEQLPVDLLTNLTCFSGVRKIVVIIIIIITIIIIIIIIIILLKLFSGYSRAQQKKW